MKEEEELDFLSLDFATRDFYLTCLQLFLIYFVPTPRSLSFAKFCLAISFLIWWSNAVTPFFHFRDEDEGFRLPSAFEF